MPNKHVPLTLCEIGYYSGEGGVGLMNDKGEIVLMGLSPKDMEWIKDALNNYSRVCGELEELKKQRWRGKALKLRNEIQSLRSELRNLEHERTQGISGCHMIIGDLDKELKSLRSQNAALVDLLKEKAMQMKKVRKDLTTEALRWLEAVETALAANGGK